MNLFIVRPAKYTAPTRQIRWEGDIASLRAHLERFRFRLVGFIPDGL